MMMKNTENKNKEFNHDKNETTIQMFSYLGAGVMIGKTKKRVEVQRSRLLKIFTIMIRRGCNGRGQDC